MKNKQIKMTLTTTAAFTLLQIAKLLHLLLQRHAIAVRRKLSINHYVITECTPNPNALWGWMCCKNVKNVNVVFMIIRMVDVFSGAGDWIRCPSRSNNTMLPCNVYIVPNRGVVIR